MRPGRRLAGCGRAALILLAGVAWAGPGLAAAPPLLPGLSPEPRDPGACHWQQDPASQVALAGLPCAAIVALAREVGGPRALITVRPAPGRAGPWAWQVLLLGAPGRPLEGLPLPLSWLHAPPDGLLAAFDARGQVVVVADRALEAPGGRRATSAAGWHRHRWSRGRWWAEASGVPAGPAACDRLGPLVAWARGPAQVPCLRPPAF